MSAGGIQCPTLQVRLTAPLRVCHNAHIDKNPGLVRIRGSSYFFTVRLEAFGVSQLLGTPCSTLPGFLCLKLRVPAACVCNFTPPRQRQQTKSHNKENLHGKVKCQKTASSAPSSNIFDHHSKAASGARSPRSGRPKTSRTTQSPTPLHRRKSSWARATSSTTPTGRTPERN